MDEARRLAPLLGALLALLLLASFCATSWLARPWVVGGPSMGPTLRPGDRVVVDLWTYRHRAPRPGEIVLFRAPGDAGTVLVKRVVEPPAASQRRASAGVGGAGIWVLGDRLEASVDSRDFGAVPQGRLVGRVVWRYWPVSRSGPVR